MKVNKIQTVLILGGAFGAGALAGWFFERRGVDSVSGQGLQGRAGTGAVSSADRGVGADVNQGGEGNAAALSNQSQEETFGNFDVQKQVEVLQRLVQKDGKELWPSSLALLAKIVPQLSADQAAELLQEPPGGRVENAEVRRFLTERLAELDAPRALELGKKLGDAKLLGATVAVMGEADAAKALAVVRTLPLDQGKEVLSLYLHQAGEGRMNGTAADVVSVLKETPALKELGLGGVFGVTELLGSLLAKSGEESPSSVIATARGFATELASLKKNAEDHTADKDSLSHGIIQGVLNHLRAGDQQAASAFFDALPDSAKSQWMFPEEAGLRFKSGGIDAAIAFAEKQGNEEFAKRAASGTWWGLAQQDRAGALAWIDSLPQGAFRSGVLSAVMWDAWTQSMSWGSDSVAIEAGAKLPSKAAQMDYFTFLMSDRRFGGTGTSPSEKIDKLPIGEDDRRELYRRIAPIKFQ
jgi:hypothetical protein